MMPVSMDSGVEIRFIWYGWTKTMKFIQINKSRVTAHVLSALYLSIFAAPSGGFFVAGRLLC